MPNIIKSLIGLSVLAFVIAVLGSVFRFDLLGVDPEGYSRACSNIALVAIALALVFKAEI
jgi:hypothetical protein